MKGENIFFAMEKEKEDNIWRRKKRKNIWRRKLFIAVKKKRLKIFEEGKCFVEIKNNREGKGGNYLFRRGEENRRREQRKTSWRMENWGG